LKHACVGVDDLPLVDRDEAVLRRGPAEEGGEGLAAYLIRRCATSLVILLGISVFIYIMLHAVYPSPAIIILGPKASPAAVRAWNAQNGFDEPVIVQYWQYLWGLLHGNLGYSYKLNQSVAELFGERWAYSAYLSGSSLALAVLIAIPLGIYQAVKRNSFGDGVVTSAAFTAYSMPDYLLYLIAIQVFALSFHIFGFEASQSTSMIDVILDWHDMTLPIVCITLLILAGYSRYMRSAAIDTLAQDYIRTARAKGLPERLVLLRHLVRNALLPMITLVGLSIPALLAGNLIAEATFNYNGLGLLFYNSLSNADYPVLLAYTLIGAVLTVLGNLLADVALTIADPRIRLA
jgi:peptide/nickel transport system permease protein